MNDKIVNEMMSVIPEIVSNFNKSDSLKLLLTRAMNAIDADEVHIRTVDWVGENHMPELVLEECVSNVNKPDVIKTYQEFLRLKSGFSVSGSVFKNGQSQNIMSIQDNDDFKDYRDSVTDPNLIQYLKSLASAVVIPLLERENHKASGVLVALKIKNPTDAQVKVDFHEQDVLTLKQFGAISVLLLQRSWLYEATTWKAKKKENAQKSENIKQRCLEIIDEARRRTGAVEGKIRFVDWKNKRLVPGVIQSEDDNEDMECATRKIGEGISGKVASSGIAIIEKDLTTNKNYSEVASFAEECHACYKEQVIYLEENKQEIINSGATHITTLINTEWVQSNEEMKNRLDALSRIPDRGSFENNINNLIQIIGAKRDKWSAYKNHLQSWKSEIAVPIVADLNLSSIADGSIDSPATILGVLNIHSYERDWFTFSDLAILDTLARQVAAEIMQHQIEILKKLRQIEQDMSAGHNFNSIASLIDKIKAVIFFTQPDNIFPLLYIANIPDSAQNLVKLDNFPNNFKPQLKMQAIPHSEEVKLLMFPIRSAGLGFQAISKLAEGNRDVFVVREHVNDPGVDGSTEALNYDVKTTV